MPTLTKDQWLQAKSLWAAGTHSLRQLSEEFDVSVNALHRRFQKEGIVKGSSVTNPKRAILNAVRVKDAERAAELATIGVEAKEMHVKVASMITKKIAMEFKLAADRGQEVATVRDNIKTLLEASKAVQTNYTTINDILGLDRLSEEDEIEAFEITELSPEDIRAMREEQSRELSIMTGGLVTYGDPDELTRDDEILIEEDE